MALSPSFVSGFLLLTFLTLLNFVSSFTFLNAYPRIKLDSVPSKDAGDPLILTHYLKKGQIELAQNLSQVSITKAMGFRSHAGFFTVDEKYNSNHYFWYFPPFSKNETAPVVLWLQGGPGGSSLFGLFTELGPLIAQKDGFSLRKYHWALDYHLIFIDNPVGTGFSFTDSDDGYCNTEACVATGLYNSLQQFFTLFPNLRNNDFYITGESYAGKYIPSLGMEIHLQNSKDNKLINLKGMAIGDGYCDPPNQLDYGNYLYQHGLLDDNELALFLKYQKQISMELKNNNLVQASLLMDQLMDGEVANFSFFKSYTGFDNYYNYLEAKSDKDFSVFTELLNNVKVRRSVHVGGLPFNDGKKVALALALDMMQSVAPDISILLNHYRMLFYNGQLDIIVAYPLTENFLRNLKFQSSTEYLTAPRYIWKVDDDVAGYVKMAGNLTDVLVRNAGHMVPKDQPKWAHKMITMFIDSSMKPHSN